MGKSRTIRRGGGQRRTAKQQPTAALLRRVAAGMLPFLRAVERSRGYAAAWSRAVVKADLDAMRRLLHRVSPRLGNQGLGSNGIGYFISFSAAGAYYSSGTTIPPGSVQFYFNPRVHRLVAKALLPYYRELVSESGYALALARAIRRGDRMAAARLVRSRIRTRALKSVRIEEAGIVLSFKYSFSKYEYNHLLIQEID